MELSNYILATAGHVDHGKSSVVKALTGLDPDRLPEEKARGITIDLGFAHRDLPHPSQHGRGFRLGIVDVPGHEDFVKNMVAGVGAVDLALLVVAADDGWMPQTEEHLHILTYLGVKHAVIALTKIDLTADHGQGAVSALQKRLEGTPFDGAPIVGTSIHSLESFEALSTAISHTLTKFSPQPDRGKPRLAVDRTFSLRGFGTVVTGTLTGGRIEQGQEMIIQPSRIPVKVRSIQSHNRILQSAEPGMRAALNLPDVTIDGATGRTVKRGDVITAPPFDRTTRSVTVLLSRLARSYSERAAAQTLRDGTIVRVHFGSANHAARILFEAGKTLAPGEKKVAELRFESDIFLLAGDRLIIRDWPGQTTLAGGVVLDRDGPGSQSRAQQIAWLQSRRANPEDLRTAIISTMERNNSVRSAELLKYSVWSAAQVGVVVNALVLEGKINRVDDLLVWRNWWEEMRARAAEIINRYHKDHPQSRGLDILLLRKAMGGEFDSRYFDVLVRSLTAEAFKTTDNVISRRDHMPGLPDKLQAAACRIRKELAKKPFDPPSRSTLAPDPPSVQALKYLLEQGELIELSHDLVLSKADFALAVAKIRQLLETKRAATASQIRQDLGSSRRVVIPLLERLDRDGMTRREGDLRYLR